MNKVRQQVNFAGISMKNPVVVASGTYGFGREYGQFYDLNELGGICCKGLTLAPREGNPPPRVAETPMGILNSVGLQNPGVDEFIAQELPELRKHDVKIIANISGNTPEEYGILCQKLSDAGVDMIEVNISCPNVKAGGLAYGTRPELAAEVTDAAQDAINVGGLNQGLDLIDHLIAGSHVYASGGVGIGFTVLMQRDPLLKILDQNISLHFVELICRPSDGA